MKKDALDSAKIVAVALRLAERQGWEGVTIAAVAKAAKLKPAALAARYAAPVDLVPLVVAELDRLAFAKRDVSGVPHDVIFDLVMARFDQMQKHREAILSLSAAARKDRSLSCALMRATWEGAYRLIDAGGLTVPPRPVLAAGLMGIYGYGFLAWRRDDSRDMAKTMAAVDRALRVADRAAAWFIPNS